VRSTFGSPSSPPLALISRSVPFLLATARRSCCLLIGLVLLPWAGSAQTVSLSARTMGTATAPVTMYEMSDFQCPYCRDFALKTMPVLEREYVATGKIRFIYITFPLSRIHAHAKVAAEVALCAAVQGHFWPVHDKLFERQDDWASRKDDPVLYLEALADSAGADPAKLAHCMSTGATTAAVAADSEAAVRTGAHSTPSFYVEGGLIEGVAPVEDFRQVLDSIYRTKTTPSH